MKSTTRSVTEGVGASNGDGATRSSSPRSASVEGDEGRWWCRQRLGGWNEGERRRSGEGEGGREMQVGLMLEETALHGGDCAGMG
jgi:hypothetical protein